MTNDNLNIENGAAKELNMPLSNEFLSVESFMIETLSKELPTATIDLYYFLLAVLSHRRNDLFARLDNILMSNAIEAIHNTLYQVVSSKCLTAIKPNRKILFSNSYQSCLMEAEKIAKNLNSEAITTEHFFLAILNDNYDISTEGNKIKKIFNKAGITYGIYLNKMSNDSNNGINKDQTNLKVNPFKGNKIKVFNLSDLPADAFKNITDMGDMGDIGSILENINGGKRGKKSFISSFCTNINNLVLEGKVDALVGRDKEINELIRILGRRKKNNAILLGGEGVGKTAIGESLAYKIVNNEVPEFLAGRELVSLDMTALMAGTTLRGMFEERVKGILDEIRDNPHYILFMDNIGAILADKGKNDYEISSMLSRSLENGEIQVIGTSDFTSYRKTFDKDPSLARRFQKIVVEAPSVTESLEILNGLKGSYEKFHKVVYDDDAISACVSLANRYIPERNLPDSAIDLLDETGALKGTIQDEPRIKEMRDKILELKKAINIFKGEKNYEKADELTKDLKKYQSEYNEKKEEYNKVRTENPIRVTKEDILNVVSVKTNIPVNNLTADDRKKLVDMDERIKEGVVGQDEAITTICKALKRNRIGLHKNGCMYSCMAIGKTGTGKCVSENTIIRVKNKKTNKIEELTIKEFKNLFT